MKPDTIYFNYYPGSTDGQYPDRWEERIIGQKGVVDIQEHPATGDGDKWFWDVIYENNRVERIFYPHQIFYSK